MNIKVLKLIIIGYMAAFSALTYAVDMSDPIRYRDLPVWMHHASENAFPDMRRRGTVISVFGGEAYAWSDNKFDPVLFKNKDNEVYYITSFNSKNDAENLWDQIDDPTIRQSGMTADIRRAAYNWAFDNEHFSIKYNNPKKGQTLILYSAMDCSYCVKLERSLHKAKLPYIVVPINLANKPSREYKNIYCADDRKSAWMNIMSKREYRQAKNINCEIPYAEMQIFGHILGTNSTPSGLMPDGTVVTAGELWQAYGLKAPK